MTGRPGDGCVHPLRAASDKADFCCDFKLKKKFFLVMLGLHCCMQAFSSCGEQGATLVVVRGLLIAVASYCRAWTLEHGLRSCDPWA